MQIGQSKAVSRIIVTDSPSTSSSTYIDADEMFLPLYFPRAGFRYELCWDAQVAQDYYGFNSEGFLITMGFDGTDEDDNIITRGYIHANLGSVSISGFMLSQMLIYNRFVSAAAHRLKGRWKVGNVSSAQILKYKRRRIWVHEIL